MHRNTQSQVFYKKLWLGFHNYKCVSRLGQNRCELVWVFTGDDGI